MAENEIHVGAVGTILRGTIKDGTSVIDISGATTMQLTLKSPKGKIMTRTAVHTNAGTDGKLQYVTVAGDLDFHGTWSIQAYVVTANGSWDSDIKHFEVRKNLKPR